MDKIDIENGVFKCSCGETYDTLDDLIFYEDMIFCNECVDDYYFETTWDYGVVVLPK